MKKGEWYDTQGSSPLARGLRRESRHPRRIVRIIPARAGFTRAGDWRRCHSRDHPRSRGVYAARAARLAAATGSSPLARGLPATLSALARPPGIIPARAGFTVRQWHRCDGAQDHPRSRGVYSWHGRVGASSRGSSPLARGLPALQSDSPPETRIIPARAGFTCCPLY